MEKNGLALTCILRIDIVLWTCLCLSLSWQQGEDTSQLSGRIANAVQWLLYLVGVESDLDSINMGLRKYAHVAVFFVPGILFFYVFWVSLPRSPYLYVLFYAVALACSACAVIAEV